ncbi:MAG TPA: hypothetical protein VGC29_06760 [Flavisolibacter sp.]
MENKKNTQHKGRHEHPLPQEISNKEKEQAADALHEADRDMEEDIELSSNDPGDDLDEGESARRGKDRETPII